MFDKFSEINWHPDKAGIRQFGQVLFWGCPTAALAWYCLLKWFTGEWIWVVPAWIAGIGWGIALLSIFSRSLALPFYRIWFFMVAVIDTIITNSLLLILFYLVISPAALIMKLIGRDLLGRRIDIKKDSYFENATKPKGPESYYNQF